MKKNIFLVLTFIILCFSACTTLKYSTINEVEYRDFKQVADNLYEITFDSYNIDYSLLTAEEAFACSSVHNGNFYGRSFDFIFSDSFELVVHTPAAKGRYASIGMTGTIENYKKEIIENHSDNDVLTEIALTLVDGINEKGVVCNINVVPVEDLEQPTTGTNPGKRDLNMMCMVRFVLDNASSAKQAVNLLKNRNICIPRDFYSLDAMGYELHMMIADKNDTYIVEFVNNEMIVTEGENVMTNYYRCIGLTPHAAGLERYDILKSNIDMADSVEGMANLMEMVQFLNAYKYPRLMPTDMTCETPEYDYRNDTVDDWIDSIADYCVYVVDNIDQWMEQGINPISFWITMHMNVFDIENKTMRVIVQERYDEPYYFTL